MLYEDRGIAHPVYSAQNVWIVILLQLFICGWFSNAVSGLDCIITEYDDYCMNNWKGWQQLQTVPWYYSGICSED